MAECQGCKACLFLLTVGLSIFAEGDVSLQVVTQPQMGYARQILCVQPIIRVKTAAHTVQALPTNNTIGFFGTKMITVESGFANFTDLGFQYEGIFVLKFNADGMDEILSSPILVQV